MLCMKAWGSGFCLFEFSVGIVVVVAAAVLRGGYCEIWRLSIKRSVVCSPSTYICCLEFLK